MPKISVIVPVYNTEKYLPRCIDSILAQTFTDFELLLINDGSTDSSGTICDEYAKKYSRIRVIHKQNGGVISARKEGVYYATGNYIYFIDSDDTIELDAIESIAKEINENTDIILSENRENLVLNKKEYVQGLLTRNIRWSNCGNLYKRELFDKYTFLTSRYFNVGEDFLTSLRIAKKITGKVITRDIHKYNYRIYSDSAMGGYKRTLEYEEKIIHEVNNIVNGQNINVLEGLFHYNTMMLEGLISLGLLNNFEKEWIKNIVNDSKNVSTSFRQKITILATRHRLLRQFLIAERCLKEFIRILLRRR